MPHQQNNLGIVYWIVQGSFFQDFYYRWYVDISIRHQLDGCRIGNLACPETLKGRWYILGIGSVGIDDGDTVPPKQIHGWDQSPHLPTFVVWRDNPWKVWKLGFIAQFGRGTRHADLWDIIECPYPSKGDTRTRTSGSNHTIYRPHRPILGQADVWRIMKNRKFERFWSRSISLGVECIILIWDDMTLHTTACSLHAHILLTLCIHRNLSPKLGRK